MKYFLVILVGLYLGIAQADRLDAEFEQSFQEGLFLLKSSQHIAIDASTRQAYRELLETLKQMNDSTAMSRLFQILLNMDRDVARQFLATPLSGEKHFTHALYILHAVNHKTQNVDPLDLAEILKIAIEFLHLKIKEFPENKLLYLKEIRMIAFGVLQYTVDHELLHLERYFANVYRSAMVENYEKRLEIEKSVEKSNVVSLNEVRARKVESAQRMCRNYFN